MVSMGIGDKPFMDIQPSNAAISDRAVKKGAGNMVSALPLTLSLTQTQPLVFTVTPKSRHSRLDGWWPHRA